MMFCMLRMLLGSIAFTSLIDLRATEAVDDRRAEPTERGKQKIKDPSRVELGICAGSKCGLYVGLVLSVLVILRGEILVLSGEYHQYRQEQ